EVAAGNIARRYFHGNERAAQQLLGRARQEKPVSGEADAERRADEAEFALACEDRGGVFQALGGRGQHRLEPTACCLLRPIKEVTYLKIRESGRALALLDFVPLQGPRHVAGDQVHLEIHPSARAQTPERGDFERMRDEVNLEHAALHMVHGQAHAVDADRALAGDVAGKLVRGAHLEDALLEAGHFSDAVDVAGDEVAAEALAHGEGFFKVHRARLVESRGDGKRCRADVGAETARGERGDGEAYALHADGIADADVGHVQTAAVDLEWPRAHDLADRLHDPGKHGAQVTAKRARAASVPGELLMPPLLDLLVERQGGSGERHHQRPDGDGIDPWHRRGGEPEEEWRGGKP